MNILYITHMTGNLSDGPTYSIPAQIKAQSKYDNVFWFNLTKNYLGKWKETKFFHSIDDFKSFFIYYLPKPFNKPDLVVFEDFYYVSDIFHSFECWLRKIPYIIVPRGALTKQGQSQKRLKKLIANFYFFTQMIRKASAIQYLTNQEFIDSGEKWNKNYFIEPNGIDYKSFLGRVFNDKGIIGTYIGRFDLYHKGLDLLIEAVSMVKNYLRESNVLINLYGAETEKQKNELQEIINKKNIADILMINDSIYGLEKIKIYNKSDFFIMTSRYEGLPMGMLEAMSYGLPCIATKGTNLAEQIKKYNAGWTCDNKPEGIAENLLKIINEKNKFEYYGQNAYKLSLNYNWNEIAKRTHDYYVYLVGDMK